jgi:hypothetical protein
VRRLISLFVVLFLVAATTAPAVAACRMRIVQKKCCCKPAAANSLCAPSCCDMISAARPIADASARVRGFTPFIPLTIPFAHPRVDEDCSLSASVGSRIGLHERAAPRLPLRI